MLDGDTKSDPLSIDSVIAWLEQQPAEKEWELHI